MPYRDRSKTFIHNFRYGNITLAYRGGGKKCFIWTNLYLFHTASIVSHRKKICAIISVTAEFYLSITVEDDAALKTG